MRPDTPPRLGNCLTRPKLRLLLLLFLSMAPMLGFAAPAEDQDWPLSSRIVDSFSAGDYARVINDAPRALAEEPYNNELRLAYANSLLWSGRAWASSDYFRALVGTSFDPQARLGLANSLAWTGRLAESLQHYEALLGGPSEKQARLGLANALRWLGRADLALTHYRRILRDEPANEQAARGVIYCERVLRPSTIVGAVRSHDSSPMDRQELQIAHSWRNSVQTRIYSIALAADRDSIPTASASQNAVDFRVEDLALPFAPRLELSQQNLPAAISFWNLRVKVAESPVYLHAGKVNWGKSAFNLSALESNLTADWIGADGKAQTFLGEFRGAVNHHSISDGNRVSDADLRLTPWWRPYGPEVRPYAGISWRQSASRAGSYWTPLSYAAGYVGIEGEWETPDWYMTAFISTGARLAGEATSSWSGGVSVKRWLARDWAFSAQLSAQSSAGAGRYSGNTLSFQLEKQW